MVSRMFRLVLSLVVAAGLVLAFTTEIAAQTPPAENKLPPIHKMDSRHVLDAGQCATISCHAERNSALHENSDDGVNPRIPRRPRKSNFRCQVPEDGEYWFLVVTFNKEANTLPNLGQVLPYVPVGECRAICRKKQPAQPQPPLSSPAIPSLPTFPVEKEKPKSKDEVQRDIDAAVANAFGKDSPEMRCSSASCCPISAWSSPRKRPRWMRGDECASRRQASQRRTAPTECNGLPATKSWPPPRAH